MKAINSSSLSQRIINWWIGQVNKIFTSAFLGLPYAHFIYTEKSDPQKNNIQNDRVLREGDDLQAPQFFVHLTFF